MSDREGDRERGKEDWRQYRREVNRFKRQEDWREYKRKETGRRKEKY